MGIVYSLELILALWTAIVTKMIETDSPGSLVVWVSIGAMFESPSSAGTTPSTDSVLIMSPIMASTGVRSGVAGPPPLAATLRRWVARRFFASLCRIMTRSILFQCRLCNYSMAHYRLKLTFRSVHFFRPRRGTGSVDGTRDLLPLQRFAFVGEAGAVAD